MAQPRSPNPKPASPSPTTVSEIIAKHPGKWVLMHTTEFEPGGWPLQGVVIATSVSRKRMSDVLLDKLRQGTMPKPYCLFKAIQHARTMGEFREILARPGIESVDA